LSPSLIQIETGVSVQPFKKLFQVDQFPACQHGVAFAYATTPVPPFFMLLDNPLPTKINVSVNGAVLANVGSYVITLNASVDGVQTTTNFTVEILDPCRRAIFMTNPNPFNSMTLIRDFDTIVTQSFAVLTDIEVLYGIKCKYAVSFATPKNYL
jgi:hypothetical protein